MSRMRSGRTGTAETVTIKFGEIELTISGYFIEGDKGDYWTPPTGSDLEVDSIVYNGFNVTKLINELLPESTYEDVINKAIEQIESNNDNC